MHHGSEAEEEHVDRKPDVGLKLLEEDIGRDLEDTIRDEEDDKSGIVLVSGAEIQVFGQAKQFSVCDVNTI